MMDPLAVFTCQHRDPPFVAEGRFATFPTPVFAVHCKTGFVMSRRGGNAVVHFENGMAAVFKNGRARFAARFLCGAWSTDVAVLPKSAAREGVCARCQDVADGPCVYRCFDRDSQLIYIGSTEKRRHRMSIHSSRTEWWGDVAETRAEHFPTLFEARAAERLAIRAEKPLHNKLHYTQPVRRRRKAA